MERVQCIKCKYIWHPDSWLSYCPRCGNKEYNIIEEKVGKKPFFKREKEGD
jgi:Zn finger protein HypA/HybF involved in hydrogenase expression